MRLDNAKILISDDSILARKQLKDFISKIWYTNFFRASNGQDAIDIYKKEKPDLSFLDIVMPVKDGNAAIREIIDFDKDAEIIIVLLSEHSHSCVPPLKPAQRILSRSL